MRAAPDPILFDGACRFGAASLELPCPPEYRTLVRALADLYRRTRESGGISGLIRTQRAALDAQYPLPSPTLRDDHDRAVVSACRDLARRGGSLSAHELARDGVWSWSAP